MHPSDGKGATHIHSLMEYAPHQLLIGSDDGLLLFNTLTCEHQLFTEDETNPYSLSNSVNGTVIGRFCEDTYGHIWIASDDGGLSCFSPKDKRFTHYLPDEHRNSLSYHNVHALCMDGDDLWIGTYTGGVNVLNTKTGVFRVYTTKAGDPTPLDRSSSYAIFKDREARIWVTSMSGVNLYNRDEDNFTRIRDLGSWIMDIDQDADENIWFSSQGNGLFKYDPGKQEWTNYVHSSTPGASLIMAA